MSDTPRTDEYVKARASLAYCVEKDTAGFARQLERELAEARELFTQSLKDRESAEKETDAMLDRLIAEEKQRDMLAAALETLMYGQEIDAKIAKQALATVKGRNDE